MILQASQTIIEFDGGDIAVGVRKDGLVGFQDIEKQEIGTDVEGDNNIFPVIFRFKNTKSIDVVIEQLQKAKEIIQKSKEAE